MTQRSLYLADGGDLRSEPGATAAPVGRFHYDPADPTPAVGGARLSRPVGSVDNTKLEARADVLVFSTQLLTEPIEVLGTVAVKLRVDTSTGYGDVFARLCDVDERGRSSNVCDALVRLSPGAADGTVTIALSSTAYRFAAGHRIRLQVSGGAHPRYARNTGTGEPLATATRLVPTDFTLHPGSRLVLPVLPSA